MTERLTKLVWSHVGSGGEERAIRVIVITESAQAIRQECAGHDDNGSSPTGVLIEFVLLRDGKLKQSTETDGVYWISLLVNYQLTGELEWTAAVGMRVSRRKGAERRTKDLPLNGRRPRRRA